MSRTNTDKGDKGLPEWVTELTERLGAERVSELLGTAAVGMARTKATIDKNLDAVLALANIPSRADYQKVQAKLDSLQGSIMSLSRTVEELRESLEGGPAARSKKGAARRSNSRTSPTTRSTGSSRSSTSAAARRTTRKRS